MKHLKPFALLILLTVTTFLLVKPENASASDGVKYEATICFVYNPDGTTELTFECIYPSPVGQCPSKQSCGATLIGPQ